MDKIKEDQINPFLTLATTGINGWYMASCPEFEVSACGSDPSEVVEDLFDMIQRNANLLLQKENTSIYLKDCSTKIVQQKGDIAPLFKRQA